MQKLYAVGTYPNALTTVFNVTFNTDWYLGARSAASGNPWSYSSSVTVPHYALFSERAAGADKDNGCFGPPLATFRRAIRTTTTSCSRF
ncbi:MAG: hypothetical protein IPP90_21230 [Gemmatimonadaceae bacterium]|nr:hypothetical protein [Gemmatimonadaceae bacterium]